MFKCFLVGILIAMLSTGVNAQIGTGAEKPNIIFLNLDDFNSYVGFLDGHPQVETPNLDRLAKRAVVFPNAYCNATASRMSRTSYMSGKNPLYTKVYQGVEDYDYTPIFREHFTAALENETVFTIPEVLKDSGGYFTFSINKTFFGYFPTSEKDFDYLNPDPCSRSKSWSDLTDWRSHCPNGDGCEAHGIKKRKWGYVDTAHEKLTRDYRTADTLIAFLDRYTTDASAYCNKPFFIATGLVRPHVDWYNPERFYSEYYIPDPAAAPFNIVYNQPSNAYPPNGIVLAPQPAIRYADTAQIGSIGTQFFERGLNIEFGKYADTISILPLIDASLTDEERRELIEENLRANAFMAYLASIRWMDYQVGRILDRIDSDPVLAANTVIVAASDHGYLMGEKTAYAKSNLWEKTLRVPFLIADPRFPGNKVCETPVSLIDLMPTFNALAQTADPVFPDGSPYPDGLDLTPLVANPDIVWNRKINSSYRFGSLADGSCWPHESVRDSRFHYIRYRSNGAATGCDLANSEIEEELYELGVARNVDPNEWNNLINNRRYADVVEYMQQFLPDSSGYLKTTFGAKIKVVQSECALGSLDTLIVEAQYENEDGIVVSMPSSITSTWKVKGTGITTSGNQLVLPIANIHPDSLLQLSRLLVQLTLSDTSGAFELDLSYFYLNTNLPAAAYDLSWNGEAIEILNFVRTGPPARYVDWFYTDGYTNFDSIPPPHKITVPGEYGVRYRFTYGPEENFCSYVEQRFITLVDSDFIGGPCLNPNPPVVSTAEFDRALFEWSPVFGASNYDIRYKPLWPAFSAWTEKLAISNTNTGISGLNPGAEYEVQVRANCALIDVSTSQSEWSYQTKFFTLNCPAPPGIIADNISSNNAIIRWKKIDEADAGTDLRIRATVGGSWKNYPAIAQDTVLVIDLDPSTTYQVQSRNRCRYSTGNFFTDGSIAELYFTTPALRELNNGVNSFELYPNPANQTINVAVNQAALFQIIDLTGRILASKYTASGSAQFQLNKLPEGVLIMRTELTDEVISASFIHVNAN